jgi:hypothetical protein
MECKIRSGSNKERMIKLVLNLWSSSLINTLIITPSGILIHEVGHYLAGLLFYHVSGSISFFEGTNVAQYIPDGQIGPPFYYAGGLFVFLVFGLIYLLFKNKLRFTTKLILSIVAVSNLIYGFWEGFSLNHPNDVFIMSGLGCVWLGLFIGICLYAYYEGFNIKLGDLVNEQTAL